MIVRQEPLPHVHPKHYLGSVSLLSLKGGEVRGVYCTLPSRWEDRGPGRGLQGEWQHGPLAPPEAGRKASKASQASRPPALSAL